MRIIALQSVLTIRYLRTVVNSYDQFDELCDSDGEKISFESGTI